MNDMAGASNQQLQEERIASKQVGETGVSVV